MTICDVCHKKIKFFDGYASCQQDSCDIKVHNQCSKQSFLQNLLPSDEGYYCAKHLKEKQQLTKLTKQYNLQTGDDPMSITQLYNLIKTCDNSDLLVFILLLVYANSKSIDDEHIYTIISLIKLDKEDKK